MCVAACHVKLTRQIARISCGRLRNGWNESLKAGCPPVAGRAARARCLSAMHDTRDPPAATLR